MAPLLEQLCGRKKERTQCLYDFELKLKSNLTLLILKVLIKHLGSLSHETAVCSSKAGRVFNKPFYVLGAPVRITGDMRQDFICCNRLMDQIIVID